MPPAFKSYVESTKCKKDILSCQPGTNKPRFVLIDEDWLVFDRDGQGWESVAVGSKSAKKALTASNSKKSEVIKISVVFGPSLPVESQDHKPWSISIELDGSAIMHPGPFYFNVGKLKPSTFDFQDILKI